jgi:hypothetical protein
MAKLLTDTLHVASQAVVATELEYYAFEAEVAAKAGANLVHYRYRSNRAACQVALAQ